MKLHLANTRGLYLVTGCGPDHVLVNGHPWTTSLILLPDQPPQAWPVSGFDDLAEDHFNQLARLTPELVLLGTGARQRFPSPRLHAGLIAARIGLETMDTGAACRTYNILASEGRQVLAALLIAPPVS